ncbi:DNA-binding transcriptional LysR family regulator [Actinomadura luteofluorescens]|uniref:DNA-binding transcriptional LysR family regulator n=1 Tax=Actinomadura luteofluorescens TaxID=46163 RepID=A0A7Y9EM70_9ACTN|nr:LysR substrate-binding domain-containing protein [Actinomadura luteofluorescens]NYD50262.1 DNA-binding transcriptional LysR family regulator [Actinomadura luteofluorescens]
MTLIQLLYFVSAVEAGSFSAAAERLRLATPSVSEQIRRLERHVGTALFERGRVLQLTDAGQALLPQARATLRAAEEAERAVADVRGLTGGLANFGLFRNADYYLVGPLVETFLREHPRVRLRLPGQNSAEVADAVRAGRLEAGLVVLPVDDESLAVTSIMRDEVRYVSADPRRTRGPVPLERLARGRLILYDAAWAGVDPTRRQLATRMQARGLTVAPYVEVERVEGALELVRRGLGDTIVASTVLRTRGAGLHSASLEEPLHDEIAVIQRRGARLSAATDEFIRLARAHLHRLAQDDPHARILGPRN